MICVADVMFPRYGREAIKKELDVYPFDSLWQRWGQVQIYMRCRDVGTGTQELKGGRYRHIGGAGRQLQIHRWCKKAGTGTQEVEEGRYRCILPFCYLQPLVRV